MAENRNRKTVQDAELYRGDFTAEELAERRRIAQQARAVPPNAPRMRRKKRTFMQKYGLLMCMGVFVLIMSGLITWVVDAPKREAKAASESLAAQQQALAENAAALNVAAKGPVQQLGDYTLRTADISVISVPANGRVDISYFNDAIFVGDSLSEGLFLYDSGIPNAYCAAFRGAGPRQIYDGTTLQTEVHNNINEVALTLITTAPVSKIYILLGTNALPSLTDEAFIDYYNKMLDALVEVKPNCTFYIQGIPPVSQNKSQDSDFAIERIRGLNVTLAQMAWSRGMHYIDLYTALADENGYLCQDYLAPNNDGIHMDNTGYGVWRDYLLTHTVYSADATYIVGSPTAYTAV